MANNLLKAGHSLTIHELVRERATPLLELGAKWADSPREVAEASEITFTSLPAPVDMEAVSLGEAGILEGSKPGTVYIDLSSNSVSLVRRVYEVFAAKGVHMLDAPVSGGVTGARSGRLAVMVGGDEAVFQRVKRILDDFGDNVVYCGGIGAGSVCKLMHNTIGYGLQTVIAECLTLGVKAGVDPKDLMEAIMNGSVGRGRTLRNSLPDTYLQGRFDPPNFALNLAHKDVGLALELGREFGVPMSVANIAYAEMTSALNRGWGDRDSRSAMLLQEERAGNIEVRIPKEDLDKMRSE